MNRVPYQGRLIRESTQTTSKRAALAHLRWRMAEFGLRSAADGFAVPTLGQAAAELLSHIMSTRKSGYSPVRSHLRNLLAHFGAQIRIAEIQPDRMEQFVATRRAEGLKDASVH